LKFDDPGQGLLRKLAHDDGPKPFTHATKSAKKTTLNKNLQKEKGTLLDVSSVFQGRLGEIRLCGSHTWELVHIDLGRNWRCRTGVFSPM
jgi:hypothetical protein